MSAILLAACSFVTSTSGLSGGSSDGGSGTPPGPTTSDGGGASSGDGGGGLADAASGGGYRDIVLGDRPFAYWRFEETGGTVAADELGLHPATYVGATLGAAGAGGSRAVALSAKVAAHLEVAGDAFQLANKTPFSFEAWVNPRSTANFPRIASTESPGSEASTGWFCMTQSGSSGPYFTFRGPSGAFLHELTAPSPLALGRLQHVVTVYDGAVARMFVDGAPVVEASWTAAGPALGSLTIGARSYAGTYVNAYDGILDEIAFYDHALTAEQVQAHFLAGRP